MYDYKIWAESSYINSPTQGRKTLRISKRNYAEIKSLLKNQR
jgi:hypothetical protein